MWIVELALQIFSIWFFGALGVVFCGMVTLFASFPNDMKEFNDKIHGIPTPSGKWFHITSIGIGILLIALFGDKFVVTL